MLGFFTVSCSFERSACPAAATLDILGDRWTILVLRDLFVGKKRFAEFLASPEEISTNILAARLKRLEGLGLVEREPYQDKPVRYQYRLTVKGADTLPILQAVARWGNQHLEGTWQPPAGFYDLTPESWLRAQQS
ncbi:MAG: helix-turn-helix transcriptional regulator [Candidatus Eremiobacteraeota bacterium]|nr:helix-turn-helix transcriptional regulator [Candidatus Eremiobacteraeota bacterium]